MNSVAITADELAAWSRYLKNICGIHLDASKSYLLGTRLEGLRRETGAANFAELYNKAKADTSNRMGRKIIDAITTRETSFFRDTTPFNLLAQKLIPDLVEKRRGAGMQCIPIRIWSAACSHGQEAYSLGMVLKELLGSFSGYDIRILGTDISDSAIAFASRGRYSQHEIDRGVSPERLTKHFSPVGNQWQIREEIRAIATFKTMNLFDPVSPSVPFDVIFCRNVAIYFTEQDRARLFRNIGRNLSKNGVLVIGATESITQLCPEFECRRFQGAVFYQLNRED